MTLKNSGRRWRSFHPQPRGEGVISAQVLGEFFHATVIRRKLLTSEEAERAVLAFHAALIVAPIEPGLVAAAIKVHRQYQTRYWDSLIIATAVHQGCVEIASEDLNDGQSTAVSWSGIHFVPQRIRSADRFVGGR